MIIILFTFYYIRPRYAFFGCNDGRTVIKAFIIFPQKIFSKNCPTAVMWADGLTKPLHGKMFVDFRNHLLNPGDSTDERVCCENQNTMSDERKECIGDEQPSGRGWRICTFNLDRARYPTQVEGADSPNAFRELH